jgi:hypothetical protein
MIWRRILLEVLGNQARKGYLRVSARPRLSRYRCHCYQNKPDTWNDHHADGTRWWSVGLLLYRNWDFSTPQYGAEAVLLCFCALQYDGLSVDRHRLSWWFKPFPTATRTRTKATRIPRLLISVIQCIHRLNEKFYLELLSLMAFYFWWGTLYIVLNRYYQKHRVWYYIIISLTYAQRCYKADQYAVPNVSSTSTLCASVTSISRFQTSLIHTITLYPFNNQTSTVRKRCGFFRLPRGISRRPT